MFHLGEYSRVEQSFEDMVLVWDLNKARPFGVVEYCRQQKSKLVYAGSSTKFAGSSLMVDWDGIRVHTHGAKRPTPNR